MDSNHSIVFSFAFLYDIARHNRLDFRLEAAFSAGDPSFCKFLEVVRPVSLLYVVRFSNHESVPILNVLQV